MKQKLKRLFRFAIGKDWYPGLDLSVTSMTIGNRGACWTIASECLNQNSIVYCVGIGEDISFDVGLSERFGVCIHAFDPTPKSLAWIRLQSLPANYHVHTYGLAAEDGELLFAPPDNPDHVSHRIVAKFEANLNTVRCPVKRFQTIMTELGHEQVDLLKMDIEGAEYAVIDDLAKLERLPNQLLVEFHHRQNGFSIGNTKAAVQTLRKVGYRLFHVSENGEEYAFLLNDERYE
ncbi:MAG: FkbM family methyltransferase [Pirellulaceae bacterium]|nr:FkbM family methyltransferase [Pirellulaceae bacterium]